MITLIKKLIKKRRLLKKYTITREQMIEDLWLVRKMEEPPNAVMDFRSYLSHVRMCEMRFCNRIKKLK